MATFEDGIAAASKLLIQKAETVEKDIERRKHARQRTRCAGLLAWNEVSTYIDGLVEQATVLRDQAGDILKLKADR